MFVTGFLGVFVCSRNDINSFQPKSVIVQFIIYIPSDKLHILSQEADIL